jgi:hypothetical protein
MVQPDSVADDLRKETDDGNAGRVMTSCLPFTHPPRRIVCGNPDEVLAAPCFPITLPGIKNREGPHSRYLNPSLWSAWQSTGGTAIGQGALVSRGS